MKWTKNWRADGRLEWVCKHNIGHPDIKIAKRLARRYGHPVETWTTHGCCGCCNRDDFPGEE